MLSVFIVSAIVHEYALSLGFGFFYPVMFCLFAVFGGEMILDFPSMVCEYVLDAKMGQKYTEISTQIFIVTV